MAFVLIIDDDEMICGLLSRAIQLEGHTVDCSHCLAEGLQKIASCPYDVVFLDVQLPDGNGLQYLPQIRETPSAPEVIIITGSGDPEGAELAIKSGSWDYIEKGSSVTTMTFPLMRALQNRQAKQSRKPVLLKREGILGNCPQIRKCLEQVVTASNNNSNVLLTGETGTGKELFALAIHANSARAEKNFVIVDCAALPENLVENILFGHEKGAYTGAEKSKEGLVKQADGGTLFLDEIGELSPSLQKVFLRVLQEHRYRPIGGLHEVSSDFRLIAATNKNLESLVELGAFRSDLLYRIQVSAIELPPLRDRFQDIKEIAISRVTQLCEQNNLEIKGFSPDFFELLSTYHWPGNIRELIHTMDQVFTSSHDEPTIYPYHLPANIRVNLARVSLRKPILEPIRVEKKAIASPELPPFHDYQKHYEQQYIHQLRTLAQNNIQDALQISGLSRSRLYALYKKYGND